MAIVKGVRVETWYDRLVSGQSWLRLTHGCNLAGLRRISGRLPGLHFIHVPILKKNGASSANQSEATNYLLGAFQKTWLKRDTHNRKQWGAFSLLASELMLQRCPCGPQWGLKEPLAWSCLTHESLVTKKTHSLNFHSALVHFLTIYFYHIFQSRDLKGFMRKWCTQYMEIKFIQTKCIYLFVLFYSLSVFERPQFTSERETAFWRYALSSGWVRCHF